MEGVGIGVGEKPTSNAPPPDVRECRTRVGTGSRYSVPFIARITRNFHSAKGGNKCTADERAITGRPAELDADTNSRIKTGRTAFSADRRLGRGSLPPSLPLSLIDTRAYTE